jgi:hypothetical protein
MISPCLGIDRKKPVFAPTSTTSRFALQDWQYFADYLHLIKGLNASVTQRCGSSSPALSVALDLNATLFCLFNSIRARLCL